MGSCATADTTVTADTAVTADTTTTADTTVTLDTTVTPVTTVTVDITATVDTTVTDGHRRHFESSYRTATLTTNNSVGKPQTLSVDPVYSVSVDIIYRARLYWQCTW